MIYIICGLLEGGRRLACRAALRVLEGRQGPRRQHSVCAVEDTAERSQRVADADGALWAEQPNRKERHSLSLWQS